MSSKKSHISTPLILRLPPSAGPAWLTSHCCVSWDGHTQALTAQLTAVYEHMQ
jgi:hypothetical protein